MESIGELINEKAFFKNPDISPNSIIGLGIGYLMEEARIPSFLDDNYDPASLKVLGDYINEMNFVIGSGTIHEYFRKVIQTAPEKYQDSVNIFMPVLQQNLHSAPAHLYDGFGHMIWAEQDPERKSELQLMELVMLSRIPSFFGKNIRTRLAKIDKNHVADDLIPAYDKALEYFKN